VHRTGIRPLVAGVEVDVPLSTFVSGQFLYYDGTSIITATAGGGGPPTGPAGGDLNGTYPNPTVDGLQGFPVSASAPATSNVLTWNGSAWAPAAPSGGTLAGDVTGASGANTVVKIQGQSVAATVPVNFQQLTWDTGSSQWKPLQLAGDIGLGPTVGAFVTVTVFSIRGRAVAGTAPTNGQVLTYNTGTSQWEPQTASGGTLAGDVTGPAGSNTVVKFQNRAVVITAPNDTEVYKWNATAAQWQPGPVGLPNFLTDTTFYIARLARRGKRSGARGRSDSSTTSCWRSSSSSSRTLVRTLSRR